jgi:predicted N-acetyltransferase YhbS
MRTIKQMEDKYLISSLDLVTAVFTDYENAREARVVRDLVEEIRGKRSYIPELELVMVDETDAPIGYCMFSWFALERKRRVKTSYGDF